MWPGFLAALGSLALTGALLGASPPLSAEPPASDPALVKALEETNHRLAGVQQRLDTLLRSGWEYRFLQPNRLAQTTQEVEKLGSEGWELVGVSESVGFVFKRRLLPDGRQ